MSKVLRQYTLQSVASAAIWSTANIAAAQEGATVDAATTASILRVEEIIVTATRREEKLQDVPLSVSAVSAEKLGELRARSAEDYVLTVPGVSFTNQEGRRPAFVVRGIPSLGSGATTARYLDETPQDVDPRLFDVERVEVLRGPQGTLYGASSMGGAIRTLTRRPDLQEYQLRVDGSFSETSEGGSGYDINAAVNVPLVDDRLALRAVGYKERVPGFVDNYQVVQTPAGLVPGALIAKDMGEQDIDGGRLTLRFAPSETLTIDANYYYQAGETTGSGSEDAELGRAMLRQSRLGREGYFEKMSEGNLTVRYAAAIGEFISSTSYSTVDEDTTADVTTVSAPFIQLFSMFFGDGRDTSSVAPVTLGNDGHTQRFTQELRLASNQNERFNWLVGGFYDESKGDGAQRQLGSGAAEFFGPFAPNDSLSEFSAQVRSKELSFFGELSYNLTSRLQATAGARRYDVENSFDRFQKGLFAFAGDINDILVGIRTLGEAQEDGLTYKALLSYQIADGKLLYAQASSGYRPGGPNSFVPPTETPTPSSQYESDELWQYELGWKTTLWNGRAQLNGALFYIDWTDIQSAILTGGGYSFIANTGKAHSQGAELEAQARVGRGLELGASASWIDTQFDSGFPVLDVDAGDPLPNIPEFTANVNARYSWPVFSDYAAFAFGQYSYVGKRVQNANQQLELDCYGKTDLRLGMDLGAWEVSLFAANIFDERASVGRFTNFSGERLMYIQPRTLGISMQADF